MDSLPVALVDIPPYLFLVRLLSVDRKTVAERNPNHVDSGLAQEANRLRLVPVRHGLQPVWIGRIKARPPGEHRLGGLDSAAIPTREPDVPGFCPLRQGIRSWPGRPLGRVHGFRRIFHAYLTPERSHDGGGERQSSKASRG